MIDLTKLSQLQLDALKEIGSIGSGHAATALSHLLKKRVEIKILSSRVIKKDSLPDFVSGVQGLMVGVSLFILGEATGKIIFLVSRSDALSLVDILMRRKPGETKILDDLSHSTIKEIANIVSGSYLSAMSDFLNLLLIPSMPHLIADQSEKVFKSALDDKDISDSIFFIETQFNDSEKEFSSFFFLIPYVEGIEVILSKINTEM
ncbi:MAG TPA: hypothetical protein ENN73_00390 [Firmicutes bacterium]|nr:hypothetical protein [Bacillota bacterium]